MPIGPIDRIRSQCEQRESGLMIRTKLCVGMLTFVEIHISS